MAFAMLDATVVLNAVNLSNFVRSVQLQVEQDELETNTMGGNGYKSRIGGLKDWNVQIEFNSDFGVGAVDATIWPLFGTTTSIAIKPTSAAVSTTNPEYQGTVLVNQVNPMGGSVGEVSTVEVQWPGASPLIRDVTP